MPKFQQMGVSAVVDGYRDYINNVGKMASATERSHSRIGRLGSASFKGVVSGAKLATGAIIGIGAAATTAFAAIGGIAAKLAIEAAPIVDLELGFKAIAENAGQVGSEVMAAMKDVSAGTIRAADLMQLYNKGTTLLGDNFQRIIPFMDQIIAQGAAIGLKPLQAVEDFTTGVARESKMILDNLGIIVNISDATETYAATLGKTAMELTATERQTAILTSAMTSLEKTSRALPSLSEFATTSIEKMKVTFQETRDEIGKALVPALVELVNEFQNALGPEAENIVDIFKRDFVPTITEMARFIGANLPKAITFARNAFIFLGRIVRGVWGFIENFVIPGFNFLYRLFVDDVAPIIRKVGEFFGGLLDTLFGGIPTMNNVRDSLLGMIPQKLLDLWDNLKLKVGEWYVVAQEWWDTHSPQMVQAFTAVKDYIVDEFIPGALQLLITEFDPVIDAAGRLWESLMESVPDVIEAWDKIKAKAVEVFEKRQPEIFANLREAWSGLILLIAGDIEDTNRLWSEHADTVIEAIGRIIEFGIDVLGMAIETLSRIFNLAITAMLGDWDRFGEIFETGADRAAGFLEDMFGGTALGDLLNIPESSTAAPSESSTAGGNALSTSVPAPVTVATPGGSRFHTEANTQNFSLTVNTSAPVEPVIADFRMLAALARGPTP